MSEAHNSPDVEMKDFFISYTGADLQWARWIDALLKAEGLTTVVQCADFVASGDFLTDMDKAVRECHRLMPVFSPAHFRSPFCQLERNAYLALDPDGTKHLILPVVVEACKDLGLLRSRTYVDVSALDESAARVAILSAVKTSRPASGSAIFPGKPAPSVPFPRAPLPPNNLSIAGIVKNDSYIPRAAQMGKLETGLLPGATVALTQALQGDGGFGKTEIAKAFLYAHAHEFDGLWWVDASAAGHALATDRLATKLGIDFPQDIDRDQLRAAICDKLAQARHLLVLDNVDDPAVLGAWSVQPPTIRLVTTRLHGAAIEKLHPVEVSELTPEEARALLRQHRADLAGTEHDTALETIAAELGHHALAVALAGAWLANHPTRTLADLLTGLREESHKISREVLQEMNPRNALGERYARGVFATLTLHLAELKHPWSRTLLEIAAFLHPGGIPLELLAFFGKDWPLRPLEIEAVADDFDEQLEHVKEAIEELHGRSLLALDDGAVLHRLTQRAIRAGMSQEQRNAALRNVLVVLNCLLADALDPMKLAQHAPLVPHAATAADLARDVDLSPEAVMVYVHLANYSHNSADYASALITVELAERHFRMAFGGGDEYVAVALGIRGHVLHIIGKLDGALCCLEEAERIYRQVIGNDHPEIAGLVNDRGSILQDIGDFDGALLCYLEAERLDRKNQGSTSYDVARDVNNRGDLLRAKGDFTGALCSFEEAEQILREVLPADHPDIASCVSNRGLVLTEIGDLSGASRCFTEAERVHRNAFGEDHPKVASDVNNRGNLLWIKGDLEEALRCHTEAVRIDRGFFGEDHPKVASDVNNCGIVLYDMGDHGRATKCFREAFSVFLRKLGPRASDTLKGADNLFTVGLDPVALAGEIAGAEVAAELELYFREWQQKRR